MLFEHPSTGLRLVVEVIRHTSTWLGRFDGQEHETVTSIELCTLAGQPVEPWDTDDCHELLAIGVPTTQGRIRLVRVDR